MTVKIERYTNSTAISKTAAQNKINAYCPQAENIHIRNRIPKPIPIHIRAVGAGGFWGEPAGEGGVVVAEGEVVEAGVGVVDLAGVGEDRFGAAAVVEGAVGAVSPGAGEGFVLQPQLACGAVGVLEEVAVGAGGGVGAGVDGQRGAEQAGGVVGEGVLQAFQRPVGVGVVVLGDHAVPGVPAVPGDVGGVDDSFAQPAEAPETYWMRADSSGKVESTRLSRSPCR